MPFLSAIPGGLSNFYDALFSPPRAAAAVFIKEIRALINLHKTLISLCDPD
jgi:hypothetical protein